MGRKVHCAAVDLGATSGRVIVGSWDGQALELKEVHRFPNAFQTLGAHAYWDLPRLWNEAVAGLGLAKAAFPKLASVGVDSWAVDSVLLDARGRLVHPVHAYRDTRTDAFLRDLGRAKLERLYALTGIPDYPYNTGCQLGETLRALPGIADVAARCLGIADAFNFFLSGKMENELSLASHTQLLDVRGETWSREAMEIFGVPAHWFGKPRKSPAKLGAVRGLADLVGVTAVLVPGHDTACAFAAMPAAADGSDLFLSTGTWSLLGCESQTPLLGEGARKARISNERMGDGGYRPLRSSLGLWLLERIFADFGTKAPRASEWKRLLADASRIEASVDTLDLSDRALFNPPSMRAAIEAQLKRRRLRAPRTLPGFVRLICDSLAQSHADAIALFETLSGRAFNRTLIVGGGSKNSLLCQATADRSGIPAVSLSLEGTAVGNIAGQLIALGAVGSLAEFRAKLDLQLDKKIFHPRP